MPSRILPLLSFATVAAVALAACGPRNNVRHSGSRNADAVAAAPVAAPTTIAPTVADADNPTGDPSFKYSAAALGKEPPEITVDDWVGTDQPLLLRNEMGKVVLLAFCRLDDPRCAPAEAMLRELRQTHPSGDFVIIELFTDSGYDRDAWMLVRKQIADRNLGWPAGYGNKVQYAVLRYGFKDIPAAYLIDADGKVVWSGVPSTKSTLKKAVDTLVKQGP